MTANAVYVSACKNLQLKAENSGHLSRTFENDNSKFKSAHPKVEISDESDDLEEANRFIENTIKYNPGMLLQIELNTPEPSILSASNGDGNFSTAHLHNNEDLKYKLASTLPYELNNANTKGTSLSFLKCTICDKEFSDENSLTLHTSAHSQRSKTRRCDYCEQTFQSKGKWYAHFKTHFNDPSFDCAFCNSSFVTEKYLDEHLKFHSTKTPLLSDNVNFTVDGGGDRNFPCTFCGKEYPDRSSILFHLRIHTSDVIFRCMYCGKMFLNKSELNLHIRIHTGDKAHICELCNKSFLTTSNLKQHFRIHTGDKPFRCPNCHKAFSNKSNLMQHVKVHTGEKPYRCKFCEKSFTTTSNLTQHLRTHTGDKPYICEECGKAFINNSNLSQHKKVHRTVEQRKEEQVKIKKNYFKVVANF